MKEENVNYLEAIQNCVKECEQCVRELQEVREREASHQTLLSEIRVNFTALLQALSLIHIYNKNYMMIANSTVGCRHNRSLQLERP